MKAYLLFAGNEYYAAGGVNDYQGDFDSVDDAIDHFNGGGGFADWDTEKLYGQEWDWYQIVLSADMSVVTSVGEAHC